MKPSKACYDLIKRFEGCVLKAYPDPGTGGKPFTIGYGSIMYKDGDRVKLCDEITQQQAEEMLEWEVNKKAAVVNQLVVVNQQQFDALVSFAYNCGVGALQRSTMLKKVVRNPNDPTIKGEFLRWNKVDGKVLNGLTRRRKAESDLYFS